MCELFAMSASCPTDVNQSLALLRPRGGETGPHADGWGVAFHEGRAARVFKEPAPAAESRCLEFIAGYDFKSTSVIAHIRKANPSQFGRSPANTHPYERELGGRSWVFAHNGKLPGLRDDPAFVPHRFQPLGDTDSEQAFCLILDRLEEAGVARRNGTSPEQLIAAIQPLVDRLAALGEFNFLLSNGELLVVYAHTRLHALQRACSVAGCHQKVALLATLPLTEEAWVKLEPGSFHVYAKGAEIGLAADSATPDPKLRPSAIIAA